MDEFTVTFDDICLGVSHNCVVRSLIVRQAHNAMEDSNAWMQAYLKSMLPMIRD